MIERIEQEGVVRLRMTNGRANALDLEFLRVLTGQLRADADPPKPLILTGTDRIFSAGVDLFRLLDGGESYVRDYIPALSEFLFTLFTHPSPVVAAVNGHAIAGGFLIAGACDRRVLARGARVGVPELRVGVPFPWLALEILRYSVPAPIAQEMALMGGTYESDEALRRGLTDELCDPAELEERALAAARAMGATPPASFRATKALLRGDVIDRWKEFGAASDRRSIELWCSDEVRAAMRRYVDQTLRSRP